MIRYTSLRCKMLVEPTTGFIQVGHPSPECSIIEHPLDQLFVVIRVVT